MEFDRTRRAIGSEQIQEEDRRRLLDTFTQAGGRVLDEKALRRQQEEARRKATGEKGRTGDAIKLPSEIKREQKQREMERMALDRRHRDILMREASGFIARFSVKLRCYMAGLTPFARGMVLPSALSFFSLDFRRALIECNIIGNELLMNEPEVARAVRKELKNPLLVEIINRARQLYDRAELSELLVAYSESSPRPVPVESIRVPLLSLLRKLYALMAYREAYLRAVNTGIVVQQRIQRKSPDLYATKMKAVETSWRLLMEKALPRIVLLVQRLEMKSIAPGHPLFEEWIGFDADLRVTATPTGQGNEPEEVGSGSDGFSLPGDQGLAAPGEAIPEAETEEAAKARKKEELSRRLFEYGMTLHRLKTPDELRSIYGGRGEYALSDIHDKAYLAFLLLGLFDDEFASILTTNKLRLEPALQGGVRINLKQDLTDVYQTIRNCFDMYRAYYHDYVEYRKALEDVQRQGNYVDGARKVAMYETRRGRTGREVRLAIRNYMTRVEKILGQLLKDIKEGGRVVANPDDILIMDLENDQAKHIHGKRIKVALRDTYAFAHALRVRLESGDLFGGVLEMSDEEFQKGFGVFAAPVVAVQKESESVPMDSIDFPGDLDAPSSSGMETRTTGADDDFI